MLSMVVLASLSIFLHTNHLSETPANWYLKNDAINIAISKKTSAITEMFFKDINLLSNPCSVVVSGKKPGGASLISKQYSKDVAPQDKRVYIIREYSDKWVEQLFRVNKTNIFWEVLCEGKSGQPEEVRVDFIFPFAQIIDSLFTPEADMPTNLRDFSAKEIVYRKDIYLPIITLYNKTADVGISIIAPLEMAKPSLTFSIKQGNLIVSYHHLRSSSEMKARTALLIVPHDGDWRPGLVFLLNEYPEYFYPSVDNERIHEGLFYLSFPFKKEINVKEMHGRNVKWVELTGYFPFYGLYIPESPEWSMVFDSDDVSLARWETGAGGNKNSYGQMKHIINLWQKYDIQVYQYFQSFEAWQQYAREYFADDIAVDADGNPLRAWRYTNLMNPDPQSKWGQHIIGQAKEILGKYPEIDGIFYDRMDYKDYDFAHSDGLTMIGQKPVYMLGFAQERINEVLFDLFHNNRKSIWGNGPTSIEVCKNLDGIMAEKKLNYLYKIQYLGCTRPIIFLPYDSLPHDTEAKLKNALLCGAFPSTTYGGKECKDLEGKYKPLFSLMTGKNWVLTPRPLEIAPGHKCNIFRTPEGNYVIIIVDLEKSQLTPHPYEYNIPITINVPDTQNINYGYILSGDWHGVNSVAIRKTRSSISIILPYHLSSSVVYLTKTRKHDLTRRTPPILIKGTTESIAFNITKLNEKNPSTLEFTTPWDHQSKEIVSNTTEFRTFVPYDVDGEIEIKLRYMGKDYRFSSWVLNKITLVPAEDIFVHLREGENIKFYCANNANSEVTFGLSGSLTSERGLVRPPKRITLKPFAYKEIDIFIRTDINDTLRLNAQVGRQEISTSYSVQTGLAFDQGNIFHDDFTHGMKDWILKEGEWAVSDRTAQGSGQAHWAIVNNPVWRDYTLEVSTRCKGSSNPMVDWLKAYIFFRIQDENNFYRFGIHGDAGVIDLYARVKGKWIKLSSTPFEPEKGKWYRLRIQVKGTKIFGYIDGRKVIEAEDNNFLAGGIGIGVLEDAMICEYKDITVR
jgi:hypothetical protein